MVTADGTFQSVSGLFYWQKSITAIINTTYSCRVGFDMIHTERERNEEIDRLIGILSVLLQEEKTTAPELAERFEVSRRTVNRDIEDLCKAGIPIRTAQGNSGYLPVFFFVYVAAYNDSHDQYIIIHRLKRRGTLTELKQGRRAWNDL